MTFCRKRLDRTGVLLVPGTLPDYGDANFRIGFDRRALPQNLPKAEIVCTKWAWGARQAR